MSQTRGLSPGRRRVHLFGMREPVTVLYNSECPVCRAEIGTYCRYAEANALAIRFRGVNAAPLADWGLTEDQALRRLHVVKDGMLHAGMPAFFILWAELPRYRFLARLIDQPVLRQVAAAVYDFLVAPAIYRWHRWRKR